MYRAIQCFMKRQKTLCSAKWVMELRTHSDVRPCIIVCWGHMHHPIFLGLQPDREDATALKKTVDFFDLADVL